MSSNCERFSSQQGRQPIFNAIFRKVNEFLSGFEYFAGVLFQGFRKLLEFAVTALISMNKV